LDKEEEKKKAAKDFVNLVHVETKKQTVDAQALAAALTIKHEHDIQAKAGFKSEGLHPEEQALMASFEKKRMILDRLWITLNQSRAQTGLPPIKRDDVKEMLDRLVTLGYLTHESVAYDKQTNEIYILTEKGEEFNQ
jgi:hypothetical protein